jgi:hypothetical protein
VTALRACVTPPNARYQGVILEVYDTPQAGGDADGYRRSIAAVNDGGRWVFHQSGTPFALITPRPMPPAESATASPLTCWIAIWNIWGFRA